LEKSNSWASGMCRRLAKASKLLYTDRRHVPSPTPSIRKEALMSNKTSRHLLLYAVPALMAFACMKREKDPASEPIQESPQSAPISVEQRMRDSIMDGFTARLNALETKTQAAGTRISSMGKKKNWAWRNKLDIIEAKKKKIIDEAIDLERKKGEAFSIGLSRLEASMELLSKDADQLLKKMK
jgi:hypothetical protein